MKNETHYLMPKQRNKSHGSNMWYGGIVSGGVIRWVSLKTKDKKVAMEWYNKMQASRFAPKQEIEEKPVFFADASKSFLLDVENVRKRVDGTIIRYRMYLKQLEEFCKEQGVTDIKNITPQLCSEFARLKFANYKANTVRSRIIMFRHFFSWLFDQYDIQAKNPFKNIVTSKPKAHPKKFWTLEQCEKIINAAHTPEYQCYFALMAYAGLRRHEANKLTMESFAKPGKISLIGKGDKYAEVKISPLLKNALNKYLILRGNEPGPLLPNLFKVRSVSEFAIKRAAKLAGIEDDGEISYHRFRHSFASNLLRAGASIPATQTLMRHADPTITLKHYSHLLDDDLDKAINLLTCKPEDK